MNIFDAITRGNELVLEYQRRARVIEMALDAHVATMDEYESAGVDEHTAPEFHRAADRLLIDAIESVAGTLAPCECHTGPADTGPFPSLNDPAIVRPAPGPWKMSGDPCTLDGAPLVQTLRDENGEVVRGVIVCTTPFLEDTGRANVALIMAAPVMLDTLEDIRDVIARCEASAEGSRAENVTRAADGILDMIGEVIPMALPIRREKEGGAS